MLKNYIVIVLALICYVAYATPYIEIDGLNGAEHWTWVEAETCTNGAGSGDWKDSRGISGYNGNPDTYKLPFSSGQWEEWNFHAPADMGENARLYLRMAANSVKSSVVKIDGENAGSITDIQTASWTYPNGMTDAALSISNNIAKGDHTLKIEHPYSYCDRSFDGFFIYDGKINTSTNSDWNTTIPGNSGWSWQLLAPPHSTNSPEITATSATITGIGLESNMYLQATLDGTAYTNGDSIALGEHELVVKVRASGTTRVYGFAGANFTAVSSGTLILIK